MSGVELEMIGFDGDLFLGENVYNPFDVLLFLRVITCLKAIGLRLLH